MGTVGGRWQQLRANPSENRGADWNFWRICPRGLRETKEIPATVAGNRNQQNHQAMLRLVRILSAVALAATLSAPFNAEAARPGSASIVDIAVAAATDEENPQFTKLVTAVVRADLATTLASSDKRFTVFAPTDEAFEALEVALGLTVDEIPVPLLTEVLLYHVTEGTRLSQSVVKAKQIRMLNGSLAPVKGATIDGANIVGVDIRASNGVIHVIDAVILP
jgi:uncharacterized surface protein with fasciclin (FAS1) repeats